jgi:hypothetical protein
MSTTMHIENLTINISARPSFPSNLLMDIFKGTPKTNEADDTDGVKPPPIGSPWPGQGGIYAGVARGEDGQPDHHLILATAVPDGDLNWSDAMAWAKGLDVEGHKDFAAPTRSQSALLYANVRDLIPTSDWYWTSTQSSSGTAFYQDFHNGSQNFSSKSNEGRVRAVRTIQLTT